jgi:hypothetical protein
MLVALKLLKKLGMSEGGKGVSRRFLNCRRVLSAARIGEVHRLAATAERSLCVARMASATVSPIERSSRA